MRLLRWLVVLVVLAGLAWLARRDLRHAAFLARGIVSAPTGRPFPVHVGDTVFGDQFEDGVLAPAHVVAVHDGGLDLSFDEASPRYSLATRPWSELVTGALPPATLVVDNPAHSEHHDGCAGAMRVERVHDGSIDLVCQDQRASRSAWGVLPVSSEELLALRWRPFLGLGGLAVVMAWLLWSTPRLARVAEDEATIARVMGTSKDAAAPAQEPRPDVSLLLCDRCGAPVPLSTEPHTRCRACGAEVEQPPAYRSLVVARAVAEKRARAEHAALRRLELLGRFAGSRAGKLLARAGFVVPVAIFALWILEIRYALRWTDVAIAFTGVPLAPMLLAPIWFLGASAAFDDGYAALRPVKVALHASRDRHGLACRCCGAPIASTTDGVATVCPYCGAQNLLAEELAASASDARADVHALAINLDLARRAFRAAAWNRLGCLVTPLALVYAAVYGALAYVLPG